jgi:hypothetical protein
MDTELVKKGDRSSMLCAVTLRANVKVYFFSPPRTRLMDWKDLQDLIRKIFKEGCLVKYGYGIS